MMGITLSSVVIQSQNLPHGGSVTMRRFSAPIKSSFTPIATLIYCSMHYKQTQYRRSCDGETLT